MTPFADYHMHTPLCGHAVGKPEAYAAQAVRVGLQEIGFSDHAPLVTGPDPKITMSFKELPVYYQMIEEVQAKFLGNLAIKMGLEADFIPGFEADTEEIINDYPYDYIIGSVHYIGEWGFDNPDDRSGWTEKDVNAVYREYYDLLRQSAKSKLFDIMGHVDLVKKFGHRATENMTGEIKETAKAFKAAGVAVEINTAGLRKPVGEMYPAPDALKIYCKAGIPLTFGSDAHDPKDVGKDFDKALALAKSVGYKEYVIFKKRQIDQVIKL